MSDSDGLLSRNLYHKMWPEGLLFLGGIIHMAQLGTTPFKADHGSALATPGFLKTLVLSPYCFQFISCFPLELFKFSMGLTFIELISFQDMKRGHHHSSIPCSVFFWQMLRFVSVKDEKENKRKAASGIMWLIIEHIPFRSLK